MLAASQSFVMHLFQNIQLNERKLMLSTRTVSPSAHSLLTTKGGSLNLRSFPSKSDRIWSMSSSFSQAAPVSSEDYIGEQAYCTRHCSQDEGRRPGA